MATTTTNFGWDIPQSTDLVKDGATAIAALGQDIDTALVDLKGGTTGQVLAKASGTDLDFSWVAQDDSNAIQNAIVDAKGDLITATAADTPARLAVGTNGHVLTADSTAATGIKWAAPAAGGMTLLSTTTLSGASTTISSIDQTYKDLQIVIYGTSNATTAYYPNFRPLSSSTSATWGQLATSGGSPFTQAQLNSELTFNYGLRNQTNTNNVAVVTIYNYANTTFSKIFTSWSFQISSTSAEESMMAQGLFDTTSAIDSIRVGTHAGTYNAGTVLIYGVK